MSGHGGCPGGPCLLRFPGVLLSRWPLRACRYRRGSADAARSRATAPAAIRAEPAAILGLRRCTARATRRTLYTTFGASLAIASTVSRRGWRRRHGTPMTIHASGETRPDQRKNRDSRRAAGVSVAATIAGASASSLRNRSLRCPSNPGRAEMFSSTSAPSALPCQGPTPPARSQQRLPTRPGPAAGGPVPGPSGSLGNNEGDRGHPSARPRGPAPVQKGHKSQPQPRRDLAVITSHPAIVALAARVCQYAPQA